MQENFRNHSCTRSISPFLLLYNAELAFEDAPPPLSSPPPDEATLRSLLLRMLLDQMRQLGVWTVSECSRGLCVVCVYVRVCVYVDVCVLLCACGR